MHTVRVSLQVVRPVETLSTQLALVGLLSCVSSAMFPIIFLGKELFATKLATETSQIDYLSAMSYHVPQLTPIMSFAY